MSAFLKMGYGTILFWFRISSKSQILSKFPISKIQKLYSTKFFKAANIQLQNINISKVHKKNNNENKKKPTQCQLLSTRRRCKKTATAAASQKNQSMSTDQPRKVTTKPNLDTKVHDRQNQSNQTSYM